MSVLAVLEHRSGKWNRMSFEALGAAAQLAKCLNTDIAAVVMAADASGLIAEVARYPLSKVWILESALLADYTPEAYTASLQQLIAASRPQAVVFPHTYQVRDYAPKLAARLGRPLVSDVVEIKQDNGIVHFVRQLFQGKLNADIPPGEGLVLLSVQAGAFRAVEAADVAVPTGTFQVQLDASAIRSKPESPFREVQRSVDLGAASLIVSVGRGIKDKDNLQIVQDLADALGAELAASRPVCDNGWLPMERQVGSSGQTVAPKVYFAVGISGAIQHLVGMKGAKSVVAINKDEDAPIFETADYGIVGDLFDVVPALTAAVRKAKA